MINKCSERHQRPGPDHLPVEACEFLACARKGGADALREIEPYTVRRTIATEMRRHGAEVWDVAGYLGHTTGYKTTERYAKAGPGVLAKAVAAIENYWDELVDRPGGEWYIELRASEASE